jgi:hypothetical protein
MGVGHDLQQGELVGCLLAIGLPRRGQRSRVGEFRHQQRQSRLLIEALIIGGHTRHFEQLGHDTFMHIGVLTDVERGEMEAEHVNGTAHRSEPAARQRGEIVGGQRFVDHVEIHLELGRCRIWRRRSDRWVRRLQLVEFPGGGGKAGVDPGERSAIGFVLALYGVVW